MFSPDNTTQLAKSVSEGDFLEESKINHQTGPILPLHDHPINVLIRKANEFITETFLSPNDRKIDLKKV
jgi:hypothetical protein